MRWAGRSSPTRAASRCSRWDTAASPTRSRAAGGAEARRRGDPEDRRGGSALSCLHRRLASGSSARRPRWRSRRSCDSDIALVFDECTPFHATRDYTARSTERTHRWLERCLRWHEQHGPRDQNVYGIVQGGVEHDLRIESAGVIAASGARGSRSAARSGRTSRRCTRSWAGRRASSSGIAPERPRHLLGIGEIDDLIARRRARDRHVRLRDADTARAPRRGDRPGAGERWRRRPGEARQCASTRRRSSMAARARRARPASPGPICTTCCGSARRPAARLVTLHNLSFVAR